MREIKFRAVVLDDDNETSLRYDVWPVGDKVYVENGGFWMRFESIHQYTGLKDKNGKEIYEGDIVKQPNEINQNAFGEYSLKEVKYNNGSFILSYITSEKGQVIPRDYTASFITSYADPKLMLWGVKPYVMDNLEVIGNIYENPELL